MIPNVDPVAITGIGGRYPRSENVDEFWYNLLSGEELCTEDETRMPKGNSQLPPKAGKVPGIEKFDSEFFGMSDNITDQFDPQFKICHETTFEAIIDAGLDPIDLRGSRTGMFIGYCYSDSWRAQTEEGRSYESVWSETFSEVSKAFEFKGPCMTYDSACASSFSAFNEAVKLIKANVIDTAIVAGVSICTNTKIASCFRMLGMTSAEGESRCMDKNASGYVRSETIASIVLQRKSAAKRIYSTVINTMTNSDGYKKMGITFPGRKSMIRLMRKTYEEVGLDPKETKYIEAHVTGTQAGDPIECRAVESVFCPKDRSDPILIGCLKSNMGHAEGASGVASITKSCLIMQRKIIPPNILYKEPNPNIPGLFNQNLKPVLEPTPFDEKIISLNSFGFGGTNIHSIIERFDERLNGDVHNITGVNGIDRLILWKARSPGSFEGLKSMIAKRPEKITTEFLSLLDTVPNLDSKWDLPYRGYFILNADKKIIGSDWIKTNNLCGSNHLVIECDSNPRPTWVQDVTDTLLKVGFRVTHSKGSACHAKKSEIIICQQVDSDKKEEKTDCVRKFLISLKSHTLQTLSLIGELYMRGCNKMRLDDLYQQIKFPVSSSTSSVSPLIKWIHDKDWTVYKAPDYFTNRLTKRRFHFDYAGFCHSFSGHKIDGRIIFPASGYLFSVWQSYAHASIDVNPDSYLDSEVTFKDVRLHRAILVEPGEEISFLIGINSFTKFFEVNQNDALLVTGFIDVTPKDPTPKRNDKYERQEIDDTMIGKKEFYKELRVRGYDYEGEFQGVDGCNPDGTGGVVSFKRNWVFFADAVFQLALINDPTRQLLLPTGFEYIHIDGSVFKSISTNDMERFKNIIISSSFEDTEYDEDKDNDEDGIRDNDNACETDKKEGERRQTNKKADNKGDTKFSAEIKEDGVDAQDKGDKTEDNKKEEEEPERQFKVIICKETREIITEGLYIKGMNATPAPRKKPKPFIINSTFRSFDEKNDYEAKDKTDYAQQCLAVIRGDQISDADETPDKKDRTDGNIATDNEDNESPDRKEGNEEKQESTDASLITVLKDMRKEKKEISSEELRKRSAALSTDKLIQVPITDPFRHQFQIIASCFPHQTVDVTEINLASKSSVEEHVKDLFRDSFAPGTQYTLFTDNVFSDGDNNQSDLSDAISQSKLSDNRDKKEKNQRSVDDYLKEDKISSELIILQHPSLGFSFLETSDTVQDKEQKLSKVFESVFNQMTNNAFLMVIVREDLLSVEKEIPADYKLNKPDADRISNLITDAGLVLISTKIIGSFVSFLARKVVNKSDKREIFKIDCFKYDWVDELRKKMFIKEIEDGKEISKPRNEDKIWITGEHGGINGLIGFIKCIQYEDNRFHGIFFMDDNTYDKESVIDKCAALDLPLIVHKDGKLGSLFLSDMDAKNSNHGEEKVPTTRDFDVNANKIQVSEADNIAYCLDVESKGDLSSLKYHEIQMPKDSEGVIDIHYSALNFKDIMVALGRVPLTAYPASMSIGTNGDLGMEYSGVNKKGERVMGVCDLDGIATKINLGTATEFVFKIPDWMSLEDAATIPTAYSTVYYALIMRGKLQEGESVLIHAGSGGVGQAAINVCLSMGCQVFTTVGTKEKRAFIKEQFPPITDDHIFDSRSVSFGDAVLRATNGRGVDVILNSLSEEKLQTGIHCLAKNGRFLEIGKYDMIINSAIDPVLFTHNQSFHSVCVANLIEKIVQYKGEGRHPDADILRKLLQNGLDKKIVKPLSRHIFDWNQAEDAFRFMANGKHIGKVLIKMTDKDENNNAKNCISDNSDVGFNHKNQIQDASDQRKQSKKKPITGTRKRVSFDPDKSYIVIGGLGGIGLEICYWMVRKGARKLVITSRTGIRTAYHKFCVGRLEFFGAKVFVETKDISYLDQAEDLIKFANSLGPVGGVFNLGMVLKDALFADQTQEMFQAVCGIKVQGTHNLDKVTRTLCPDLDHFVCFSSMVSMIGNGGQSNYGYANSFMDMLCMERRVQRLPGLAVGFGAVGDVGHVAEHIGHDSVVQGSFPQRINSCFDVLEQILYLGHPCVSTFVPVERVSYDLDGDILSTIFNVLGIKDHSKVDPKSTLGDLGLDSLMAVEIKQILEKKHNKIMSTKEIREMTVQQIKDMQKEMKLKGKKISDGLADFDQTLDLSLPTKVLEALNEVKEGEPIFILPPIEGAFDDMKEMIKKLSGKVKRPLIGINWTEKNDAFDTIEEVASFYLEQITSSYPDLMRIDVMAYSFGSLSALEMAIKREGKDKRINKLIILDFSPKFGRLYPYDGNYARGTGVTFFDNVSRVIKQGIKDKRLDMNEKITKIPQDDPKWVTWLETARKKTGNKYTDNDFIESMDRIRRRYKMIYDYQPMKSLNQDILLIRASDSIKTQNDEAFDHDYDLSKHVSGNVSVIMFDGDHKTFITHNSDGISSKIAGYLVL